MHFLTECDSCTLALLADLEKMDDALVWLKQQMEDITNDPASLFSLNRLQANITETKVHFMKVLGICLCSSFKTFESLPKEKKMPAFVFKSDNNISPYLEHFSPLLCCRSWLGGTALL